MTVINGLAYDEHRGEGQVILMDYLGEVFQHTTIYFLIGPRQVVASGDGRVLRIFHQQFLLNVVDNGGGKEDAHRRLTLGKKMQLFFLRHRRPALPSCQYDGLRALGDGKLAS